MMKNKNTKSAIITLAVLSGLIATNVLLNLQWYNIDEVKAFALNADAKNANNTPTVDDSTAQGASDIAMDAHGNYVITWMSFNQDGFGNGVYFRRFDSYGNVLTTGGNTNDVLVNTTTSGNQTDPVIAMDQDGNFVIAWAGEGTGDTQGIFMRAYLADGTAIGTEQIVNTTTADGQYLPAVAIDYNGSSNPATNPNVVFAWYKYDAGFTDADVYMRRFGVDFGTSTITPIGTDTVVNTYTTDNQYEPNVAMNNFGEITVSWHGTGVGFTSGSAAWIQAYDNDGTVWGDNTSVNNGSSASRTDIAADKSADTTRGGNFVITFDSNSADDAGGIFAKFIPRCDVTGCDITNSSELLVNTSTTGVQTFSSIAADGMGNFTISWSDENSDSDGYDVFAQNFRYNKGLPYGALSRSGTQYRVNTASNQGSSAMDEQTEPAVAMSTDGFYAISYTDYPTGFQSQSDVHYQQFVSDLMRNYDETLQNLPEGASPVSQTYTDVAMSNSGLYATVWVDQTDGGVKFTLRDSNNNNAVIGTAATRLDNPSTAPNATPSVSFYKDIDTLSAGYGRFIVAWQGTGDGSDIYYREVDSAGNLLGSPTVLNSTTTGSQTLPRVEAGFYSAINPTDAIFSAIWFDNGNDFITTYHEGAVFTENTIATCSSTYACSNTAVDLNPWTGDIVYAWDDSPAGDDIFAQRATEEVPNGSPIVVDTGNVGVTEHFSPDVAFIKDGTEFVVVYTHEGVTGDIIQAKTYNHSTGSLTDTFSPSNCSASCNDFNPKVASTISGFATGDMGTLFVWGNTSIDDYDIIGALWRFDSTGNTFERFSPNFRISSTQTDGQYMPSVSMNGYIDMVVGWEGRWEDTPNATGTTTDTEAAVSQLLVNPIYLEPLPNLAPEAEQEIQQGGRTLSVPDTIVFPSVNVNTTTSTSAIVSIRDAVNGGCTTTPTLDCTDPASKYIEVEDLDGTPFTLTIIADTDFTNDADSQTYITRSDFFVRNWDQSTVDTDTNCGSIPESCYLTINPLTPPITPTFTLDTSTNTVQPLNVSQTLATKTGTDIGTWRLYPDWLLNIGALTPPGNHSTTVTITLQ